MLLLKYFLLIGALATFAAAAALVLYDLYLAAKQRRLPPRESSTGEPAEDAGAAEIALPPPETPIRWRLSAAMAAWATLPLLFSLSIQVVPSGMAGIRVSQLWGTRPGTLYPGVHFIKPLIERLALYDIRDRVFATEAVTAEGKQAEVLSVQAREGLTIGLAVTLRYRLDPARLHYIESSLPQPVEDQLVPPAVSSVFRDIISGYMVRDVFGERRGEIRQRAAEAITEKLGADGILVKEVVLRDIVLPAEYAKGLEGLLLKQQENDRLAFETEIEQKNVRIAELQAEAAKAREVKRAEGQAQVRVLQAKAESDAMQYTLPLKEKQIQQTRLEAEAKKESTVKNAEAAAQAKVIDSRAELERRNLLAEAEANRIRVKATADAERMKSEALALKSNPLLINKIIAEKLSDKVQIMMVPNDGKFFLTNELMQGAVMPASPAPADPESEIDFEDTAAVSAARTRSR
jgi:regulator of protease activity HflC (stomatin/prohibitin superfamily)